MMKEISMNRALFVVLSASLCLCVHSSFCRAQDPGPQFKKLKLTDTFYCEGANFGDFNHDGKMDVVSGPYWYEGPGHCEWQSAAFLHVGWPLGSHWSSEPPHRTYVRDPEGIFNADLLLGTLDEDATLPPTADDTGYHSGSVALWLDPSDEGVAFLVSADHVERWPRFKEFVGCA